jgi:hypothetical protein
MLLGTRDRYHFKAQKDTLIRSCSGQETLNVHANIERLDQA